MRRARKIVLWLVGGVVAVCALIVGAFFLTPESLIAGRADAWARANLGRGLALESIGSRRLLPAIGADFNGVALENAPWAGPEPLLAVERVSVDLDPLALLAGRLEIADIRLINPVLRAALDEEGRANWRFEPPAELSDAETAATSAPSLAQARLEGGRLLYTSAITERGLEIADLTLSAMLDDDEIVTFDAEAAINGRPARLSGRLPDPAAALQGRQTDATLRFEGEGARLDFTGALDLRADSLSAKGELEGSLSADKALTAWLRRGLPDALEPLGEITLRGELDAERAKLNFDLNGEADYNGAPLTLTANATGGENWRRGAPIDATWRIKAGALLTANGAALAKLENDRVKQASGWFQGSAPDWTELRRWAGLTDPIRPVGAVRFGARLMGDAQSVTVRDASITVGDNRTRGAFSLDWRNERPQFEGSITDGPLDLALFLPGVPMDGVTRLAASDGTPVETGGAARDTTMGELAAAAVEESGAWSTQPLPLQTLAGADGRFNINLKGVAIGEFMLGRTGVDLELGQGGLSMNLKQIALYDGVVSGSGGLTTDGDTARLIGDLKLDKVQTEPLIAAFGRRNWLRGPVSLQTSLAGSGAHLAGLARSLSGQGRISMENGALLALDFAAQSLDGKLALFGARQTEAGVTPFTLADASFKIESGVLTSDDLRVRGNVIRARGEGDIDIGARAIDFVVTPIGFGEISFLGIDAFLARAFPVRLSGPWGDVRATLNREQSRPARFIEVD